MFHCLRVWDALCDGLVRSLVLTSGSLRLSYPSSVTPATPESRCRYMLFCKCCWPGDIDTVQSVHSRNPCRQDPHVLKRPSIFKSSRSHFVNAGVAFIDCTMIHNVWIVNNPPFQSYSIFLPSQRPVSRILHLAHSSSKSVFFNKRTMPHPLNWETLENILISWKIKRICKTNIVLKFCL